MRRLFLVLGVLVLGSASLVSTSSAGDYDLSIGLGWTVPTGILGDPERFDLDGSLSVSGALVGPLSGPLHWRAEVGHDDFGANETGCATILDPRTCIVLPDLRLTRFSGGLQVAPDRTTGLRPFAYVTGGLYHITSGDGVLFLPAIHPSPNVIGAEERSGNFFGVALGAGAEWLARENWSFGVEVRVNGYQLGDAPKTFPRFDEVPALGFKPDPESHWYVTPSLFFALRL